MESLHGTTVLAVRRDDRVVIGGDGQVTLGNTVMKGNARKVRRLYQNKIIAGFAGGTADAFTLFERFEGKLEKHGGHLTRAAVELAKDWRTDRLLRRLEALLIVADLQTTLIIEILGFAEQLLVDLEMSCRRIVDQPLAKHLQRFTAAAIKLALQLLVGTDQLMTFLQPAINQLMHPTPALLGISAFLEHGSLASLDFLVLSRLPRGRGIGGAAPQRQFSGTVQRQSMPLA